MPYTTQWESKGIVWKFYGDVTATEISNANDEFYSNPQSDKAKYQIIDALQVTTVEWSELNIKKTAAYDIGANRVIKDLKVAYVADNDEIISKLENYIEISRHLNSSWQFKGFHEMDDAREWVNP